MTGDEWPAAKSRKASRGLTCHASLVTCRTLKILLLKPSSLGDVIQALPVLRLLKGTARAPKFSGGLIPNLAPLLEGDPDLAGVVRFERRRWAAPRHSPEMLRSIRWMREQNFDWVIDLQCLARSGAFAWLANGKFLIGLDEVREGARGFYDVAVRATLVSHPRRGLVSGRAAAPGRAGS